MFNIFKKADIVLAIILILLGTLATGYGLMFGNQGTKAVVTVDGQEYGTYDLSKDQTVKIIQNNHHNEITIKDGTVSMSFSDCQNQVCVHSGAIRNTSQVITCLPNHVMVQIQGEKEADFDAISN